MSKITVKEIKDDAIIHVPVNKNYYIMVKALLYNLFIEFQKKGVSEETLQNIMKKDYLQMSDEERSFYTVTILLAEIERQATTNNLIVEKEVNPENNLKSEDKETTD